MQARRRLGVHPDTPAARQAVQSVIDRSQDVRSAVGAVGDLARLRRVLTDPLVVLGIDGIFAAAIWTRDRPGRVTP